MIGRNPLMRQYNSKGFTLLELIIVLTILAILAVIVMSSLGGAECKAKKTEILDKIAVCKQLTIKARSSHNPKDVQKAKGCIDEVIKLVDKLNEDCLTQIKEDVSKQWKILKGQYRQLRGTPAKESPTTPVIPVIPDDPTIKKKE
ncbi:MAG: type II secretion system protein [Candidatus Scalindua sp.]